MKSFSTYIQEFSEWQRKELEALFIVLDWTKDYKNKHPDDPVGKEWLNATELTIRILYDEAFNVVKNRGIAFHSGSDTTEAPPEVIRNIIEELSKNDCSPFVKIESSNYYCFARPSTSSESNDTCSDMVNYMYFGPAYKLAENRNSSTEDVPFGFQFPNSMHFNFGEKMQGTSVNLVNSTSSLSCQSTQALSGIALSESEQKEMFLPFPAMYLVRPTKDEKTSLQAQGSMKQEGSDMFGSSKLDLTKYFDSSLESQNSNPAIEFFRISSGFIPPPKNSDIAKRQCTSPFCLCSSVKASYKDETNDDSLEDDDEISEEVSVEPYLEVENISFPKLELPDLLDDTNESYMIPQPFNTPNNAEELETSNELVKDGTPRNNREEKELILQPFNTSRSSNINTPLNIAELGLDVAKILPTKSSMDNEREYIRQERLRILFSYEKNRRTEQKESDENEEESNENENFANSSPNWSFFDSSKEDDDCESRDC